VRVPDSLGGNWERLAADPGLLPVAVC
jgi:hypothetical protein